MKHRPDRGEKSDRTLVGQPVVARHRSGAACIGALSMTAVLLVVGAHAGEEAARRGADRCPEDCGEVLRFCLEETRKRHECLALTDACSQQCKAGSPVLDERGRVLPGWTYREGDPRTTVRW